MKNINKQSEPKSLTQHRCNTHSNYDNFPKEGMNELRESLNSEQMGICCYCMQRIKPNEEWMKVEHWECQNKFPARQLDYSNMLGACRGGHGKPYKDQHCDTRKGKNTLSINPSNTSHDVELKFRYLGDGTIKCNDQSLQVEIDDTLNLNKKLLKSARRGVMDAFKQGLGKRSIRRADWNRELSKWTNPTSSILRPFSQVVVYYIKKKLA